MDTNSGKVKPYVDMVLCVSVNIVICAHSTVVSASSLFSVKW